jgi:glutamine amidotransferase-like uncharacterized protein
MSLFLSILKRAFTFYCFGIVLFHASSFAFSARPIALVYFGPGVCAGCPDDLASALTRAGYRVKKAFPTHITPDALEEAAIFAVPGGDEERDVMRALAPGEAEAIRQYVSSGGHYLGVCLGAYLAVPKLIDTNPAEDGLNLFDGTVTNHSPTKEARMEYIHWQSTYRWIYFQDGPEFHLNHPENADIWAYYKDGSIAAFQSPLGLGRVGLIGPHLEATQEWLNEDHISVPTGEAFHPSRDLLRNFLQTLVL